MASSGVTLDRVSIEIKASASDANQNISQLTQTLSELRSATKGGFNNLSKLAQSLSELKSATSNLSEVATNIQSLTTISDAFKQLEEISNPKGLEKALENLEKLPSVFDKITPKSLENVTRVSTSLAEALSPLADKLGLISQGFSSVSQLADKYGVSVTKIREYTKQTTNHTKNLSSTMRAFTNGLKSIQKQNENFFKSLSKGASNIISKVKQIGLSLLGTRTIFTATRKAVSEYMAMDAELTWYITNNWRALGAQLAPAIEYVAWLFKQFVRVVYSVILALTGIDLIARANEKAMRGWGKAAKDTLGNLQRFDDLNVVEFPKGSGGDDNKLIELDTIDLTPIQKIIDWVRKLRDEIKAAWESGEWYGVGKVLAEGINSAVKWIDFGWIEEQFANIANKFGDFLRGKLENLDWDIMGSQLSRLLSLIPRMIITLLNQIPWKTIGDGLNSIIKSFDVSLIIDSILGSINTLLLGIQDVLLQIDGSMVGEKIGNAILSIFTNFNSLLNKIEWKKLGTKIKDTILNIPWGEVFSSIINTLISSISGLGELLDGVFGTDLFTNLATTINDIVTGIENIGITTINTLGEGSAVGTILSGLETILNSITQLIGGIAKTLSEWLISEEFQQTISFVSDILGEIFDLVGHIFKSISDWWNSEGGEHVRSILESLTKILNTLLKPIVEILKVLFDVVKWLWDNILFPVVQGVIEALDKLLGWLADIVSFISNVFANNWEDAFEDIKKITNGVWDAIKNGFKNMINGWIGSFETGINWIIDRLNWFVKKLNNIFDSDVMKELGINFRIKEIGHISIPKLESGTNEIPYEGIYHLHPGESVVPKKYNPALGGGTNEETNRRLDTLIDAIENQEHTTNVYIGNDKVYKGQRKYSNRQVNKYGTIRVS